MNSGTQYKLFTFRYTLSALLIRLKGEDLVKIGYRLKNLRELEVPDSKVDQETVEIIRNQIPHCVIDSWDFINN